MVLVDEAGFYLLPGVVRTYAPCGDPPVLRVFHTRDHLSAISGITRLGQLYTLLRKASLTSAESAWFLRHLLWHLAGKLLVVWDGSTIHRGEAVKDFLAEGAAGRVHLEVPRTSIRMKASGIISRMSNCETFVARTWIISVMNSRWPSSACAASRK
jgi:hypothetical protein